MSKILSKHRLLETLTEHLAESYELLDNEDCSSEEVGVKDTLELYIRLIERGDFDIDED